MKAMRKRPALYMIGAAVLMVVLAGCTATIGPSLTLQNAVLTTNWHDENGNPVICQNRVTTVQYRFDVRSAVTGDGSDQVGAIEETYAGQIQGGSRTRTLNLNNRDVSREGATIAVTTSWGESTLPRSLDEGAGLETSAIIVVPITPVVPTAKNGESRLTVVVRDTAGLRIGTLTHTFDVYGGCTNR